MATSTTQAGEATAADLLQAIFADAKGFIEFRTFKNMKTGPRHFTPLPMNGNPPDLPADHDVFFGVAPRTRRGGTASDVVILTALWCDVDGKAFERGKSHAWEVIQNLGPLAPSAIIDSGHGFHCYWFLHKPMNPALGRAIMDALREAVAPGLDHVSDAPRILRLPGTLNHKGDPPVPVRIIELSPERRFNERTFSEYLDWTLDVAEPPVDLPNGNPSLPADKLKAMLANDDLFARSWERARPDLKDQSPSAYEISLATRVAAAGWTDTEIAALLIAWGRTHRRPDEHPEKVLRKDYLERTIAAARKGVAEMRSRTYDVAILRTDVGNAARLVAQAGHRLRWCGPWGRWLVWDGVRWRPDDREAVLGIAKSVVLCIFDEVKGAANADERAKLVAWAMQSQRRPRVEAMIKLAQPDLAVTPDDLDADLWLLNVENGTVDLRTGELRPHDPGDLITKGCPVDFNAEASCGQWLRFLDRVMAGDADLIAYLQRIVGICLTGDVSEQVLFFFYGTGANGKSVFLDTISSLLGPYATEAPPGLLTTRRTDEHPTEIADLCGRRLVVGSETEEGRRLRVQLVKQLTGNARLKGRFMRRDYFEFTRTHKLIIVTNHRPEIRETTHAVWRRIRIVPFKVTIPESEQDRRLLKKLRSEWPGILGWALAGCLAWQKDGLRDPREVRAATQEYRDEQNPLAEFLPECCILAPNAFASRADIFAAYRQWAEVCGESPLDRRALYERLRNLDGVTDGERRVHGQPERGFQGLGLVSARHSVQKE